MRRIYTIQLVVEAEHTTGEAEIANAINEALDEPPCDWGDWEVSLASVVDVKLKEPT